MKKILSILLLLIAVLRAGNMTWTEENRKREAEQIAFWERNIAESKQLDLPQKMERLELGLKNMKHRTTMDGHDPRIDQLYQTIQTELISMPGHAEYQKQIIEDALDTLAALPEQQKLNYLCGYRRTQGKVFDALELLPSPETVRVLGDFLADERGGLDYKEGDPFPTEDDFMCYQVQNYLCAATALNKLIDDPLSKRKLTNDIHENQYLDWRLWYNQIKAGTKPIRFKGDPKEYYLENVGRVPETNRAARRPSVENHVSKESSKASKPVPIPRIAGIVAILIALGGWLFMRKKAAS